MYVYIIIYMCIYTFTILIYIAIFLSTYMVSNNKKKNYSFSLSAFCWHGLIEHINKQMHKSSQWDFVIFVRHYS